MNVGIVGANGQVGTELAFRLDGREDVTVTPIVRNQLGTHFLSRHGFDCRVADVGDPDDAARALADLDTVAVAAFAWQYSNEGFQSRGARETNESLVRNAVRYSPADATVVYFSSLAAFGDDLGAPNYSDWSLYTREKRNAERVLFERCERHGTAGYVLRLGNVHGPNQENTAALLEAIGGRDRVEVAADPDAPSNALHTVTLCDAVLACGRGDPDPGRYSLVNEPQWTWRELVEHYADPGTDVTFAPPAGGSLVGQFLGTGWKLAERKESTLRTFTVLVPDEINQRLFYEYLKFQRGSEIGRLEGAARVERDVFEFDPVPGPFLPDLTETRTRLERSADLESVFAPE